MWPCPVSVGLVCVVVSSVYRLCRVCVGFVMTVLVRLLVCWFLRIIENANTSKTKEVKLETTTQQKWKSNVESVLTEKGYIALHITTKDGILETWQVLKSGNLPSYIDALIIQLVDPVVDFPKITEALEKMEGACMRAFRNHERDAAESYDELERVKVTNPRFWFRLPLTYIDEIIDLMAKANTDEFALNLD